MVCPSIPDGIYTIGHPNLNYGANIEYSNPGDGQRPHQEHNMPWNRGDWQPNRNDTGTGTLMRVYRSKVRYPSNKLQHIDTSHAFASIAGAHYPTRWDLFPEAHPGRGFRGTTSQVSYRHNEGANLLLLDGHSEYRSKFDVFSVRPDGSTNNNKNRDLWWAYR